MCIVRYEVCVSISSVLGDSQQLSVGGPVVTQEEGSKLVYFYFYFKRLFAHESLYRVDCRHFISKGRLVMWMSGHPRNTCCAFHLESSLYVSNNLASSRRLCPSIVAAILVCRANTVGLSLAQALVWCTFLSFNTVPKMSWSEHRS